MAAIQAPPRRIFDDGERVLDLLVGNAAIVVIAIGFARALGIDVIAEGKPVE